MEIQDFIVKFAEQFDETDVTEFVASTKFRELDEWSSLIALSIIAMVDEEYDVTLKGDDMRQAETIEELFNIVKGNMALFDITKVRIAGISACVPKQVIRVEDSVKSADYDSSNFAEKTGIKSAHISNEYTASDLCYNAAEKLINDLEWNKTDVGALFLCLNILITFFQQRLVFYRNDWG